MSDDIKLVTYPIDMYIKISLPPLFESEIQKLRRNTSLFLFSIAISCCNPLKLSFRHCRTISVGRTKRFVVPAVAVMALGRMHVEAISVQVENVMHVYNGFRCVSFAIFKVQHYEFHLFKGAPKTPFQATG